MKKKVTSDHGSLQKLHFSIHQVIIIVLKAVETFLYNQY